MTTNFANKVSLKVPFQLPEFIRSDTSYQTFVAFIQAYYEWMEQNNIGDTKQGVVYGTQNLLNYADIDFAEQGENYNRFIDYFFNEFLPSFPKEALGDKTMLVKASKELYGKKGTPAAYQFLFRALYNSDAELFPTRNAILRASDGKWYVSKSLRLATNDEQFLSINNLRILGETSKSIATVERGIAVGNRIELYISDIQRLFQSGETIYVTDNTGSKLYFKDGSIVSANTPGANTLSAKILGSISSVQINPKKRGQLYVGRSSTYSGDPVVFYGGLNSENGVGATAYVNETTTGSLRDIALISGGYGYREDPNTYIRIAGGGGSGAIANVTSMEPTGQTEVTLVVKDYLSSAARVTKIGGIYTFFGANTTANVSASLANTFSFDTFQTYPIGSLVLNNGGGGYRSLPTVTATSLFDTTDVETDPNLKVKADLASLGILSPVQIVTPGTGYANGEFIVFTNSSGNGANANVTVNSTGSIVSVQYQKVTNSNGVQLYPKGGLGYSLEDLPTLSVATANGSGAVLTVPGVLGTGAEFLPTPDERGIGAITSFVVENFGEDYIQQPNITLKVRDIVVQNVSLDSIVKTGEMVYQGTSRDSMVFSAYIDSIRLLETGDVEANSKYLLRTYNYTANTKIDQVLKVTDREVGSNVYYNIDTTYETLDASGAKLFDKGIRTYGNGSAEATAKFLNGLIIGEGQYLNDDGFPSSYQILQNEDYNNFSYQLTVEKSFKAYKDTLFKLLHPAGTKVLPVEALKSATHYQSHILNETANSHTLGYYTGDPGSNVSMFASWTNTSNNIVKFDALVGSNLATYIYPGSRLSFNTTNGPNVSSIVVSVNHTSNTVTLKDNVFLRYANVATANVSNSNSTINIQTLTGSYDLINNGEYTDSNNKLRDIVFAGDVIRLYANSTQDYTGTVSSVDYANNKLTVTPPVNYTANSVYMSVGRDISSIDVRIYNTLGVSYQPELITEDGQTLTTEDNLIILLG